VIRRRSRSSRRIVPTKRSAIAFARGARTGVLTILDLDRGEDRVEGSGELAVAVADEEPEALVGVVEVHEQVARLLCEPGSGRVGGDAEDVDSAGGVFDNEERVEPLQRDGVEVEQVAGQDRLGLCAEELRPGRSGPSRCGIEPGGAKDLPDGRGADPVAESGEFAVDAAIPPGRVLGGQPQDQRADAGGDGGSARAGVRGGPPASDEVSVPAQDR
jgi:hypothetical protein